LSNTQAVVRRQQAQDVVARGPSKAANKAKARDVESQVGTPIVGENAHARAGPLALPHEYQQTRNPEGHSFYEIDNVKARKQP
jgi:hypothetical protein